MLLWLKLGFYVACALVLVAVVAWAKHQWTERCGPVCEQKIGALTKERDGYIADINNIRTSQQNYVKQAETRIASLSVELTQATKERDDERTARFADVEKLAAQLRDRDARIRIGADTVRVLQRAVDAANSTNPSRVAGPAAGIAPASGPVAPDSNLALLDEWVITASRLYSTCVDRVGKLVQFYDGVRGAVSSAPPPLPPDPTVHGNLFAPDPAAARNALVDFHAAMVGGHAIVYAADRQTP